MECGEQMSHNQWLCVYLFSSFCLFVFFLAFVFFFLFFSFVFSTSTDFIVLYELDDLKYT